MFIFGDSFDLYAVGSDALAGYWDSGIVPAALVAGRLSGSQALQWSSSGQSLVKSSGVNDAVHHIVCAVRDNTTLSGTSALLYFQLSDATTAQCSIVFRSDGAVLLTSGGPTGTTLATYTGAVTAGSTWFAFEFEVIISNTVGRFRARKNGNTVDDFDSGATLNTRPGTNAYANKLTVGMQSSPAVTWYIDDMLWRSDASSVAFVGDIRAYTRLPASDASVQFSRSPATFVQTPQTIATTIGITAGTARYTAFTAAYDGTIGTATVSLGAGYTGNLKCSIFASSGSAPTTVLGSATVVTNPVSGANTLTFGTPVSVTKNTQYWIGWDSDTSSGTWNTASGATGLQSTTAYASFPTASPTTSGTSATFCTLTITPTTNYQMVNEAQQDGTTSYVYDSTAGDVDFYAIASLSPAPASVVAVTTRGFIEKSDAGTRTGSLQIKSGGTTVATPTVTLSTNFGWAWRTDTTDPNTGSAWTAGAVSAVNIGPKMVS